MTDTTELFRDRGIEVVKGRQLRSELKRMGADMAELKEVHKKVATIARKHSRQIAPYSGITHRGGKKKRHLRDSIRVRATRTRAALYIWKKHYPWAPPIHWGWPKRNIEARPFMSIGVEQSEPRWYAEYEKHVHRILESCKED